MKENLKVVHDGVEIEYQENTNRWRYELRGRERFTESLAKAKEIIDRPEPKEKAPFDRKKVWMHKSYSAAPWSQVTVTSLADNYYGQQKVWVVDEKGARSKEYIYSLFVVSPSNDEKIAQWKENEKQIKVLDEYSEKLVAEMERLTVPKEVTT